MKTLLFILSLVLPLSANAQTLAEKLTTLSLDKTYKADSAQVQRTQAALTRGLSVCNAESEEKLANIAWYITKKIRAEGHYAEATEIIEGANAVLLGAKTKQDCAELLSLYTVNRLQGGTHSDAVAGARGLYRSTGIVD